jgi:hypothetical protein
MISRRQAHYHPDLNESCVHDERPPLAELPNGFYVYEEDGSLMLLVAAAVVLAAIFLGVLWVLFAAFG